MFEKVLVATDSSPAADKLLDCVPELSTVGAKEITLVRVADISYPRGGMALDLQEHYRKMLEEKREALEQSGFTVHIEVPIGFPPVEIVETAKRTGTSLIVIGSRGENMVRELLLGSTVADVIRISPIPTLIERIQLISEADRRSCQVICERKFQTLLLATDLSGPAKAAEDMAVQLASHAERVILLSVVDRGDSEEDLRSGRADAEVRLRDLEQRIATSGTPVKAYIEAGIASQHIAWVAEAEDVTLIVMGKRGQGRLADILLGSTAEAVARRAKRPVLLVPSLSDS